MRSRSRRRFEHEKRVDWWHRYFTNRRSWRPYVYTWIELRTWGNQYATTPIPRKPGRYDYEKLYIKPMDVKRSDEDAKEQIAELDVNPIKPITFI